jgi:hypothetical protein
MSVSDAALITSVGTRTAGNVRSSAALDERPDQVESQPRALIARARPSP